MKNKEESNTIEIEVERLDEFQNETMPHQDALYNYALKVARNSEDAHDLVQETYYKALKNYRKFEIGTNSKAWLLMILKNTFINNYRKRKREATKLDYEIIEDSYENIKFDHSSDNNLELGFYKNLLDDELSAALAKLPVKIKEIFLLFELEGYTYEEIAQITNIPTGTVRSRLHRARKILQEELIGYAKVKGYLN
jgi:RNA polymerase sigma-70 factor (ECF subfamily)